MRCYAARDGLDPQEHLGRALKWRQATIKSAFLTLALGRYATAYMLMYRCVDAGAPELPGVPPSLQALPY